MELPRQVVYVLQKIRDSAGQAFLVGGAVRDMLLARDTLDYDIASSLLPDAIEALFKNYKTYGVGKRFGTIGVLIDDLSIEVTTMRSEDKYTDSRHPDNVHYVDDIEKDLSRRDFTINAIAYNPLTSSRLIDPFKGKADLEDGIIKTVGDAGSRFKEDPLRMLRALRFASQLGFKLHSSTYNAIVDYHSLLNMISRERIRDELTKLLTCQRPDLGLLLAQGTGISDMILPLSNRLVLTPVNLETIRLIGPTLALRLSALVYYSYADKRDDTANMLKDLRYEKALISQVSKLVGGYSTLIEAGANPYNMRRLMGNLGRDNTALLLSWFMHESHANSSKDMQSKYNHLNKLMTKIIRDNDPVDFKDLAISGSDVLALGIGIEKPELVGKALEAAYDLVLHKPHLNNKRSLTEMMKQYK
ncbi:MAG TPA: hypothetical protein VFD33_00545 [Bacillota bacterium]|nr:hypothetical protein [Bacillota bacterium]